jgi:hypothetical protein
MLPPKSIGYIPDTRYVDSESLRNSFATVRYATPIVFPDEKNLISGQSTSSVSFTTGFIFIEPPFGQRIVDVISAGKSLLGQILSGNLVHSSLICPLALRTRRAFSFSQIGFFGQRNYVCQFQL